uniref:Uncharacterized protein n=1 Tax=Eptatretus burgeri TaxID=7764 RepID=A0A8C4N3E8_EPTBU
MESQNGGAASPWRDTKWEWAINSTTNGTTQGGGSQPPVQTTWSRHAPWQARQDDYANIGGLRIQLGDALEQVRRYENYIKEVQIKLDEAQRHADEVQKNDMYEGVQQLQQMAYEQKRIRWLENHFANTAEVLLGEMIKVEWFTREFSEHEKRENKRIEEEQIGISQDRKSLEEYWKTKLEKEKCEHDLELKQLKEEVKSGNQIKESLEQKIKRGEKSLEQRKEELLEKSKQFEELQGEMRKVKRSTHELEQE